MPLIFTTTLYWEVDVIINGKRQLAASGSTTVGGNKAQALAHWAKYFVPHGYRLISVQ